MEQQSRTWRGRLASALPSAIQAQDGVRLSPEMGPCLSLNLRVPNGGLPGSQARGQGWLGLPQALSASLFISDL